MADVTDRTVVQNADNIINIEHSDTVNISLKNKK